MFDHKPLQCIEKQPNLCRIMIQSRTLHKLDYNVKTNQSTF